MDTLKQTNGKKRILWITAILLVLALLIGSCGIYVSIYYHADTGAIEAFAAAHDVQKSVLGNGVTAYGSAEATVGFLFYPGGKVEHTAYEPLLYALASRGIFCVLLEMPFRLAVLDPNAADGIAEDFPSIEHWYIGGHSLGGSMAATYAASHTDELDGIVLLGAYSTKDLSKTTLRVLSLYGSEDGVMNRKKYEQYKTNLPDEMTEIEIAGGCHAYFGMYGEQDGDGVPTLTPKEQIALTANYITAFFTEEDT